MIYWWVRYRNFILYIQNIMLNFLDWISYLSEKSPADKHMKQTWFFKSKSHVIILCLTLSRLSFSPPLFSSRDEVKHIKQICPVDLFANICDGSLWKLSESNKPLPKQSPGCSETWSSEHLTYIAALSNKITINKLY